MALHRFDVVDLDRDGALDAQGFAISAKDCGEQVRW